MQAEEGTLVVLAAGERSLFDECQTCFEAMGRNSFFLGDVGNASKMYLILQTIAGVTLGALSEGMALGKFKFNCYLHFFIIVNFVQFLADRAGLQQKDLMEVLQLTSMSSQLMIEKGNCNYKLFLNFTKNLYSILFLLFFIFQQ